MPAIVQRHPRATLIALLAAIGLVTFGLVWFEPQKLVLEDRVDEDLPGAVAPAAEAPAAEGAADEVAGGPQRVASGRFIGLEHQTSGRAVIVQTGDGRRFLRFEDFRTSNGPDLVVYLSAKRPAGPDDWYGYDGDFVDLGPLKGNVGNQNYAIPRDVDLERYSTAVVWCRRFTVGFAAAVLEL
ncbi:MAG TPA: DM13 domain-containing protein [Actinomycetota bacterium]|nr:DM13 domain-containing protein [Actinomycetota bacterium]